jgi:hypothetical protein
MYVVTTASAAMPSSCMGQYRHVRVVKVCYYDWVRGLRPTSIRSKQVLQVVSDTGPWNVGKTERCAYAKALVRANELASRLNNAPAEENAAQIILEAGGSA